MPRFFLLVFSLFIASSQLLADNASSLSVIDKQITANSTALETFLNAESASDYRSALEQFKSLHKSDPTNAELSFYLGRSLYHQGEFEAADEVLSKNIENHPRHYESHYVLGSVKLSRVSEVNLFRKASMAKAAIAAWEKTVELKPDHVEALYGVVEFYYVAPGFAGGDEDIAALRLEELARLSQPWAQLTRASRAMTAESFKESEALFEEAIAGIPNRAFPQMMLANLYMKQEQYDKALEALERYKEREHTWNDPGPAQTGLMTARIYQGLEKPTQAIEAIELALSENPNDMIRSQAEELLKDLK